MTKSEAKSTIVRIWSNPYVKMVIYGILVVILLVTAVSVWLDYYTRHGEYVTVPDLNGMTLDEAEDHLNSEGFTYMVLDSSRYNRDYRPSAVLEQDPLAGTAAKGGRKIYLKVNRSSYEQVMIPYINFENDRVADVERRLKAAGFRIGKREYVPHIGLDVVLGISCRGNRVSPKHYLPKQSVIDLTVGDGGRLDQEDPVYTDPMGNADTDEF